MTDLLEEKFKNHVKITNQCLEFAKGEPEATMTETNLAMIELGDLKQKMTILRTVVEKLKLQTKQAETIAQYMHRLHVALQLRTHMLLNEQHYSV